MPGRSPQQQEVGEASCNSLEAAIPALPDELRICPNCKSKIIEELSARTIGGTAVRWEVDLTCHNCNEPYSHYANNRDYRRFQKAQEDDNKEAKANIEKEAEQLLIASMGELVEIFKRAIADDLIGAEDFKPRQST